MPGQRKPNDLSRSLIGLDMDTTLIAVVVPARKECGPNATRRKRVGAAFHSAAKPAGTGVGAQCASKSFRKRPIATLY
jgi:hypothetical protein